MAFGLGQLTFTSLRNLPKVQIPFDALAETLTGLQTQQDVTEALLSKQPKYLSNVPAHQKMMQRIQSYRENIKQKLQEAAMQGDVNNYLNTLSEASLQTASLFQPGGVAYNLEQDYAAYQKALQDIKEGTKDYTHPEYAKYFKILLNQQLQGITEESLLAGPSGITTPDMIKEVDIPKDFTEFMKDYFPDTNVDFGQLIDPRTGQVNQYAFTKITEKGIDPQKLQQSVEAYFAQPHIQKAIEVRAVAQVYDLPPDQQQVYVEQAKEKIESKFNQQIEEIDTRLDTLKELNDKQKRAVAKQYGFDSFAELEQVLLQNRQILEQNMQQTVNSLDPYRAASYLIEENYKNMLIPKYTGVERKVDVIWDKAKLEFLRFTYNKKLEEYKLDLLYDNNTNLFNLKAQPEEVKNSIYSYKKTTDDIRGTIYSFSNKPGIKPVNDFLVQNSLDGDAPSVDRYYENLEFFNGVFRDSIAPDGSIDVNKMRNLIDSRFGEGAFDKLTRGGNPAELVSSVEYMRNTLMPMYENASMQREQMNNITSHMLKTLTDDDLRDFARDYSLSYGGKIDPQTGIPQLSIRKEELSLDEVKERIRRGDPEIMSKLMQYVNKKMKENPHYREVLTVPSVYTAIDNDKLNQRLDKSKLPLGKAIIDSMDAAVLKQYGIDPEGPYEIKGVMAASKRVDGKNNPAFVVTVKIGENVRTIMTDIDPNKNPDLLKFWEEEMSGVYLENTEIVTDPQGNPVVNYKDDDVKHLVVNYFDAKIAPGNGIKASHVETSINYMIDSNTPESPVNVFYVNGHDGTTYTYETKIVQTPTGRFYMVAGPKGTLKNIDRTRISDPNYVNSLSMVDIVPVPSIEYDDINRAITQLKFNIGQGFADLHFRSKGNVVMRKGGYKTRPLGSNSMLGTIPLNMNQK